MRVSDYMGFLTFCILSSLYSNSFYKRKNGLIKFRSLPAKATSKRCLHRDSFCQDLTLNLLTRLYMQAYFNLSS